VTHQIYGLAIPLVRLLIGDNQKWAENLQNLETPYMDEVKRATEAMRTTPGHAEYCIERYVLAPRLLWDLVSLEVVYSRIATTKQEPGRY
jgi:hypothetical protein